MNLKANYRSVRTDQSNDQKRGIKGQGGEKFEWKKNRRCPENIGLGDNEFEFEYQMHGNQLQG